MATINFPISPNINDEYTFNGKTWMWNGSGWVAVNGYVHPNHSGDVTSVADGAQTIGAKKVTVAMLADGTDGQLITWDANGVAAVVAVGTATHVLTSNGAGATPTFQAVGGAWELITPLHLDADTPSFDFTSIPSTYSNLKVILSARSDRNGNDDTVIMKLNNDAGNNYIQMLQYLNGTTPTKESQLVAGAPYRVAYVSAATQSANWVGNTEITFYNYAGGQFFTTWQARGFEPTSVCYMFDAGGIYLSATAINQITFSPGVGTNFKQYSRADLYGLK